MVSIYPTSRRLKKATKDNLMLYFCLYLEQLVTKQHAFTTFCSCNMHELALRFVGDSTAFSMR